MPKFNDIDWIFFDVGGVLADDTEIEDIRDQIVAEAAAEVRPAPTPRELHAARIAASKSTGNMTENMIVALVSDEARRALVQSRAKELQKRFPPYAALSRIRPEAKSVLTALAPHYMLGIMANQPASTRNKLDDAGIGGLFSQAGMSHDYGFHKPDPRLYEAVLRETGAAPGRSVMVDDNYERGLRTAKNLGFRVAWYVENNSRFLTADADPDWTISRLEDLVAIFA